MRCAQGTVERWDAATGAGTVLLDDGSRLPFEPAAFAGAGLRLLRPGQRLALQVEGGRVTALSLPGWP